jgi:hypothetical protein
VRREWVERCRPVDGPGWKGPGYPYRSEFPLPSLGQSTLKLEQLIAYASWFAVFGLMAAIVARALN